MDFKKIDPMLLGTFCAVGIIGILAYRTSNNLPQKYYPKEEITDLFLTEEHDRYQEIDIDEDQKQDIVVFKLGANITYLRIMGAAKSHYMQSAP